jgi:hypothetical protein
MVTKKPGDYFMQDNQRQAFVRERMVPYCSGLIDADGSICLPKAKHPNQNWECHIREDKVSYFAGLMDGEGSFSVQKCDLEHVKKMTNRVSPVYAGKIRIGMVTLEPLEILNRTFPGGRILHEGVRKDRPTNQFMYRWELCKRKELISTLHEMIPFLIAKREQAIILLDFLEKWEIPFNRKHGISPEELQRREEAYLKMRKLNSVGAAATTNPRSIREDEVIV